MEVSVPVEVVCGECGTPLDAEVGEVSGSNYRVNPAQITVKPCEKCVDKARREGREEAEESS